MLWHFYLEREKEEVRWKTSDLVKSATWLWKDQLFSYTLCTLQVPFLMFVLFFHQAAYSWCHKEEDQHIAGSDPIPSKLLHKACAVRIAALCQAPDSVLATCGFSWRRVVSYLWLPPRSRGLLLPSKPLSFPSLFLKAFFGGNRAVKQYEVLSSG